MDLENHSDGLGREMNNFKLYKLFMYKSKRFKWYLNRAMLAYVHMVGGNYIP